MPLDHRQGLLLMALSYFLYACGDAAAKWLVVSVSLWQILAVRSLFGLGCAAVLGRRPTLRRMADHRSQWRLLPMNLANLAGWACFYRAAAGLDLPQLYSLYYLTPLLSTLLAGPVLGERASTRAWISCGLGLAGVLLANPPVGAQPQLDALVPGLLTPLFWAVTAVLYRRHVQGHSDADLVASNNLVMALACALLLPWLWRPLQAADWGILLLVGVLATLAHLLYIKAIRRLPLAVAAPMSFSSLIWSVLLGYLLWDSWPTWNLWLGAALVLTAAALPLLPERALRPTGNGLSRGSDFNRE
ncbi:DMT family transporter [Metapseudomonas resinovorans]|uniref:EamA domain-containing protein n=1 Tax=Metapseudomonas resinovorans NBRC 106553 TaxID=1245471 RepID=S6AZV9_METRE|nr:DMT family transporter [Pseudomonas resinovorans]BAN50461.1 hypothetical protein PCA10_47290 [Pseudomonas resinovorans NBRC 106553]